MVIQAMIEAKMLKQKHAELILRHFLHEGKCVYRNNEYINALEAKEGKRLLEAIAAAPNGMLEVQMPKGSKPDLSQGQLRIHKDYEKAWVNYSKKQGYSERIW